MKEAAKLQALYCLIRLRFTPLTYLKVVRDPNNTMILRFNICKMHATAKLDLLDLEESNEEFVNSTSKVNEDVHELCE